MSIAYAYAMPPPRYIGLLFALLVILAGLYEIINHRSVPLSDRRKLGGIVILLIGIGWALFFLIER